VGAGCGDEVMKLHKSWGCSCQRSWGRNWARKLGTRVVKLGEMLGKKLSGVGGAAVRAGVDLEVEVEMRVVTLGKKLEVTWDHSWK